MIRTFALSGLGSALSIAIYGLFIFTVGVGAKSDSFFAVLAVTQTIGTILFAPYETFVQRFSLDRLRSGEEPAWPLLISYLCLSLATLLPYYALGERILGPLFAGAYTREPALWRYHFYVLGALIPLTGVVAIMQVYCQARGRYDLPKVALVVGRLVGILVFLVVRSRQPQAISVAIVLSPAVASTICWKGSRIAGTNVASVFGGLRSVFLQWFSVSKWGVVLKTDALVERILAAHVTTGFLSLFSLGWSAVMSIVDAYQSSYVVADSNRYYQNCGASAGTKGRTLLISEYRRSSVAALWLTGVVVLASLGALGLLWAKGWGLSVSGRITSGEVGLLVTTLILATYILCIWKQFAGMYTIQDRAVAFAKYLTLVYLCLVGPRIALTWAWGAIGFCAGLLGYYGAQVLMLGHSLPARLSSARATAPDTSGAG